MAASVAIANPISRLPEISGVSRGRELTRKDARLASGIPALDTIIGGGIARGRISEITGNPGSGLTSLAASFIASATRRGEVAAWIDAVYAFDPATIAAAGADLTRILWVGADSPLIDTADESPRFGMAARRRKRPSDAAIKTAEMVLAAGGFGLIVLDLNPRLQSARPVPLANSIALRLARTAERTGAAVLIIAANPICGTFAVLSLVVSRSRPRFSRLGPGAPILFDGLEVEAEVVRNKLGASGNRAAWPVLIDTLPAPQFSLNDNAPARIDTDLNDRGRAWRDRKPALVRERGMVRS